MKAYWICLCTLYAWANLSGAKIYLDRSNDSSLIFSEDKFNEFYETLLTSTSMTWTLVSSTDNLVTVGNLVDKESSVDQVLHSQYSVHHCFVSENVHRLTCEFVDNDAIACHSWTTQFFRFGEEDNTGNCTGVCWGESLRLLRSESSSLTMCEKCLVCETPATASHNNVMSSMNPKTLRNVSPTIFTPEKTTASFEDLKATVFALSLDILPTSAATAQNGTTLRDRDITDDDNDDRGIFIPIIASAVFAVALFFSSVVLIFIVRKRKKRRQATSPSVSYDNSKNITMGDNSGQEEPPTPQGYSCSSLLFSLKEVTKWGSMAGSEMSPCKRETCGADSFHSDSETERNDHKVIMIRESDADVAGRMGPVSDSEYTTPNNNPENSNTYRASDSDYDIVDIEDDADEKIKQSESQRNGLIPTVPSLSIHNGCKTNTEIDDGCSVIVVDSDPSTDPAEVKSCSSVENYNSDHDYEYTEPWRGQSSTSVQPSYSGETRITGQSDLEDEYGQCYYTTSELAQTASQSPHVYSKLQEPVRTVHNPYNQLPNVYSKLRQPVRNLQNPYDTFEHSNEEPLSTSLC